MNQLWNLFAILLSFVHCTTASQVGNERSSCVIDNDKSVTVHNLKYNCNQNQLRKIFLSLPAGTFPPNGKLKGSILIDGLQNQTIWNGKRILYRKGHPPNDRGILTNILFNRLQMFNADVYRTKAPIDGNGAFILNYERDRIVPFVKDYIREVQKNLFLGIMTIRRFEKVPVLYFLLDKV